MGIGSLISVGNIFLKEVSASKVISSVGVAIILNRIVISMRVMGAGNCSCLLNESWGD